MKTKLTKPVTWLCAGGMAVLFTACMTNQKDKMENKLKEFIDSYVADVAPLNREANIAYFDASISGKEEDYQKSAELQVKLSKIYADKARFAQLKEIRESGKVEDPVLKRQLEVLYHEFLGKQLDEAKLEAIINMESQIEKKFSTFRAEINGKTYTDNDIEDILRTSTKTEELKDAWLASKKIGEVVAEDVINVVKMRNEAARELGFSNYHEMSLKLDEQDPKAIEQLFDELDNLTRDAFAGLKDEMDTYFASRYGVKKDELRPWHYQNRFFQEAPKIYAVDLDHYYKDKNIEELAKDYYSGIGLSIDEICQASDLYEKEGKYQHAYCTDIDHEGDVRMVCNLKPTAGWMNTMLHESGHAVYDKYMNREIPYALREPAHTFTTEAIAMLFGRFASNPQWMHDMLGISREEQEKISGDSFKTLRLEQLVFSRWVQVMYRFEKAMYADPDQDLNTLWWDLVEKYQMLTRPEDRNAPDWASKIHVATVPCYYHNYMLGELLASQLYYTITDKVMKVADVDNQSFKNNKQVGEFLNEKVFDAGRLYYWDDMIEKATGEKLTAKYYARQFVK